MEHSSICPLARQMLEYLDIQPVGGGTQAAFPKVRLLLLIEAGTHLIVDALMCPYRIGERARVLMLLRSVTQGMLLIWDTGLHSDAMVRATLAQKCDYLGRVPNGTLVKLESSGIKLFVTGNVTYFLVVALKHKIWGGVF